MSFRQRSPAFHDGLFATEPKNVLGSRRHQFPHRLHLGIEDPPEWAPSYDVRRRGREGLGKHSVPDGGAQAEDGSILDRGPIGVARIRDVAAWPKYVLKIGLNRPAWDD